MAVAREKVSVPVDQERIARIVLKERGEISRKINLILTNYGVEIRDEESWCGEQYLKLIKATPLTLQIYVYR